jgi:NADPH:quinone reductase-like Zn-dependent oxidoreductase
MNRPTRGDIFSRLQMSAISTMSSGSRIGRYRSRSFSTPAADSGVNDTPRPQSFEELNRFLEEHQLHPVVDAVFPWSKTTEAFRALKSGKHFGKLVFAAGLEGLSGRYTSKPCNTLDSNRLKQLVSFL